MTPEQSPTAKIEAWQVVALHEAAHAAVALHFGFVPTQLRISLSGTGEATLFEGRVQIVEIVNSEGAEDNGFARDVCLRQIAVCLAGLELEKMLLERKLFEPSPVDAGDRRDAAGIDMWINRIAPKPSRKQRRTILATQRAVVRTIILQNFKGIFAAANAVNETLHANGFKGEAILDAAQLRTLLAVAANPRG